MLPSCLPLLLQAAIPFDQYSSPGEKLGSFTKKTETKQELHGVVLSSPGLSFPCQPRRVLLAPKITTQGTSLAVQWLGLHASTAGGVGSIPGQGTKIPHASQCGQKKKKKKYIYIYIYTHIQKLLPWALAIPNRTVSGSSGSCYFSMCLAFFLSCIFQDPRSCMMSSGCRPCRL